jgi:hypothetical protein
MPRMNTKRTLSSIIPMLYANGTPSETNEDRGNADSGSAGNTIVFAMGGCKDGMCEIYNVMNNSWKVLGKEVGVAEDGESFGYSLCLA